MRSKAAAHKQSDIAAELRAFSERYNSPVGPLIMYSDSESLTGLYFEDPGNGAEESCSLPVFEQTRRWLDAYFSGKDPGFMPPLRTELSPFAKAVEKAMLAIPYGKTESYGNIAKKVASELGKTRMSAQAVGGAVGRNPISIIIPCHRVIGSDGSLTGYGGGLDRKVFLLNLEGSEYKDYKQV